MAKRISALVFAFILLFAAFPDVRAEDYPQVAFTTVKLRFRAQPSDSASVITQIPKDSAVILTGESGDYYAAAYEGYSGYVMKQYIRLSAAATVQPVQTPSDYSTIEQGSSGDNVKILQQRLKELGYYTGAVDGKCGAGTVAAIRAFQQKNALTADGKAGRQTLTLLYSENAAPKNESAQTSAVTATPSVTSTIELGSSGDAVRVLQQRLKELGYYTGTVDGKCGAGTVAAIRAFQQKNALTADGKAGRQTQTLLYSEQALPKTETPAPTALPTAAPTAAPTTAPTATPGNLAVYPYTTTTNVSVNLRKGKGTSTARITTIPRNASVSVQYMDGDYLFVKYGSYSGYIPVQYANVPDYYLYQTPETTETAGTAGYVQLSRGESNSAVKALQSALKELGFYVSALDGIYGAGTASAVSSFQSKNGITATGTADVTTLKLLFEGKPRNASGERMQVYTLAPVAGVTMREGNIGDAVTELQQKLYALGYFYGNYSDTYNAATVNAVKNFQKDHNLTADGKAGPKTMAVLNAKFDTITPEPTAIPAVTASFVTPEPTSTPQMTPISAQNVVTIRSGATGDPVIALQRRLVELGYYSITPDGIYNEDDVVALKSFQRNNGLTVDGVAGYQTQSKLFDSSAVRADDQSAFATQTPSVQVVLRIGSTGDSVKALQSRLIALGYLSGNIDGMFGTKTAQAVTAFQKQAGLTQDGVAGARTLSDIYAANAATAPAATPTPAPTPTATPFAEISIGSRGETVKSIQTQLTALGYTAAADGIFGSGTYRAVVAFQQNNGLSTTGAVNQATYNMLYSSSARRATGATAAATATPAASSGSQGVFTAPKASEVRYANWYDEIRERAKAMPNVIIYDPITGLHYNLHIFSNGKHADCEPPTAEDTAIMNQIIGTNNWTPKAVWVIFSDGRVYLGSTHSHGHEVDHTPNNNLTGHVCLHFPRDMAEAEATGPYAVSHQKAILAEWERIQSLSD